MNTVGDLDRGAVERGGRTGRARAEQVGQELPAGLGDDRRVDAEEAAAVLVVVLERGLLGVAQHVTGGVEEHDRAVALEVGLREDAGRAAGLGHAEAVPAAEVLECVDALAGRAVDLAARLGEGQHAVARRRAAGRRRAWGWANDAYGLRMDDVEAIPSAAAAAPLAHARARADVVAAGGQRAGHADAHAVLGEPARLDPPQPLRSDRAAGGRPALRQAHHDARTHRAVGHVAHAPSERERLTRQHLAWGADRPQRHRRLGRRRRLDRSGRRGRRRREQRDRGQRQPARTACTSHGGFLLPLSGTMWACLEGLQPPSGASVLPIGSES